MVRRAGLEFCCLSVPLVNVGVYLATLECLFVSLCLFCLAIFAPPIVAGMDVLPPWYKPALAGLGGFSVVLHLLGLTTIARQSTTWYRAYLRIHFAATLTVLVLSITGIVVMAMGHDRAAATCRSLYGNEPFNSGKGIRVDMLSDALKDSGRVICNVFTYIQLGAMAGLIALMGLTQMYMCLCQRAYGQRQREASDKQAPKDHEYGGSLSDKCESTASLATSSQRSLASSDGSSMPRRSP